MQICLMKFIASALLFLFLVDSLAATSRLHANGNEENVRRVSNSKARSRKMIMLTDQFERAVKFEKLFGSDKKLRPFTRRLRPAPETGPSTPESNTEPGAGH
ncbi:hypothetical protein Ancab_035828 [Ancistrocladus abbreviatus]